MRLRDDLLAEHRRQRGGIGAVVWLTIVWVIVTILASLFGAGEVVTRPFRDR